jgi:hypothetical protein
MHIKSEFYLASVPIILLTKEDIREQQSLARLRYIPSNKRAFHFSQVQDLGRKF